MSFNAAKGANIPVYQTPDPRINGHPSLPPRPFQPPPGLPPRPQQYTHVAPQPFPQPSIQNEPLYPPGIAIPQHILARSSSPTVHRPLAQHPPQFLPIFTQNDPHFHYPPEEQAQHQAHIQEQYAAHLDIHNYVAASPFTDIASTTSDVEFFDEHEDVSAPQEAEEPVIATQAAENREWRMRHAETARETFLESQSDRSLPTPRKTGARRARVVQRMAVAPRNQPTPLWEATLLAGAHAQDETERRAHARDVAEKGGASMYLTIAAQLVQLAVEGHVAITTIAPYARDIYVALESDGAFVECLERCILEEFFAWWRPDPTGVLFSLKSKGSQSSLESANAVIYLASALYRQRLLSATAVYKMLQMLVSDLIAFEQVFAVHQLMKGLDTRFPTSNPKAFQTIMQTLRDNHQRIRVTFMRDRLEEGAVASQYRAIVDVACGWETRAASLHLALTPAEDPKYLPPRPEGLDAPPVRELTPGLWEPRAPNVVVTMRRDRPFRQ